MTLEEAQKTVDQWINTTGVRYFNELTNTAILMEEVGDLGDELADILFVLICLANQTGTNLTEALQKNLEKKNIRDADRHKNNEKLK